MDRTKAAELISSALAAEGPSDNILSVDAFAKRMSIALDAIGMLQYADVADRAPIEPTGAKSPSREELQRMGGASPDQLEGSTDVPWATTRRR